MKKYIFAVLAMMSVLAVQAQTEITIEPGGTKIIKGFTSFDEMAKDSSFKWFQQNLQGFTPNQNAVEVFGRQKDSLHILAFGGTWCGDTQNLFPKFYAFTTAAGFPQSHVTVIGMDRSKKTILNLHQAFNVTHVPTFIVLKNGREIGRVVEYGKYGLVDRELGEIVSKN